MKLIFKIRVLLKKPRRHDTGYQYPGQGMPIPGSGGGPGKILPNENLTAGFPLQSIFSCFSGRA